MAITNVRHYFLDTLVESTGVKSGLAVSVPKAIELLQDGEGYHGWLVGNPNDFIRLYPDELEATFLELMHRVGAIPDTDPPAKLIVDFCRRTLRNPSRPPAAVMKRAMQLNLALMRHLEFNRGIPRRIASMSGISELIVEISRRDIMTDCFPISRSWDGVVPLVDLFCSEEAPGDPGAYFDQRYIDYLSVQFKDLTKVNWRQFERLTAEHFHRRKYKVTIGPGRNDGGIDVRAEKDRVFAGPELVIIQCRRYSGKRMVKIEEVKALWADVQDEGAAGGLIATTTRLAKNARAYCDARSYRLNRAEHENVVQWIRQMASHGGENVKQRARSSSL